jgi:hypothetical protein
VDHPEQVVQPVLMGPQAPAERLEPPVTVDHRAVAGLPEAQVQVVNRGLQALMGRVERMAHQAVAAQAEQMGVTVHRGLQDRMEVAALRGLTEVTELRAQAEQTEALELAERMEVMARQEQAVYRDRLEPLRLR